MRKIISLKLEHCESMQNFLSRMNDLSDQLVGIGVSMSDLLQTMLTVSGLPDRHQPFTMVLQASGRKFARDLVVSKLNQYNDEAGSTCGSGGEIEKIELLQ